MLQDITIPVEVKKQNSKVHYYYKALKWYIGNISFGLFPILLTLAFYAVSKKQEGLAELYHLIHDGVIIFVFIAVMGAVMVEYLISGFMTNGWEVFIIYIFPLLVLGLASLEYLLSFLKVIDGTCFALSSLTTKFICGYSFLYCIFIKANLYIKENIREQNSIL